MAHEDAAPAAINQPSHGEERRPRPLKRWRLFVAGKGGARLVMQSPRIGPERGQPRIGPERGQPRIGPERGQPRIGPERGQPMPQPDRRRATS